MSELRIHSHAISRNFTIIHNDIINSTALDLTTKALLIWMLSKPPQFKFSIRSLVTIHKTSQRKIEAAVKLLQDVGHLYIQRSRFGVCIWHVTDTPQDIEQIQAANPVIEPCHHNDDMGKQSVSKVTSKSVSHCNSHRHHSDDHDNDDVLIRTDLLTRTETSLKDICASRNLNGPKPESEDGFKKLWSAWPNRKNRKRSYTAFNRLVKSWSGKRIEEFVNMLCADIQQRVSVNQLGFTEMMLSTYLNGERWQDDVTAPAKTGPISNLDRAMQMMGVDLRKPACE